MIYYIRYDTDHGYNYKDLLGKTSQHWSIWFDDNPFKVGEIGYCHVHPTDKFRAGSYYLFIDKRQEIC